AGQSVLVNDCSLVPAFKNITLEIKNPLGQSIKKYVDGGNTVEGFNGCPGDHWSTLGASMQKYLAGQIDRAGLASEIEAYWAKQAK
ncbi:MAG: carbohydrate ABC transporter substrate-binding protein, partial [Oscillospiraceae bacterium]|nr:carbohydrate ABC transporter substrate-binding protein [Oscillospiraceae bacterium]